ncbi:MAG: formylglycine-generating enzyme family protein, partial [Candidatus Marinimicrobia bacterium]|nr:formylglycine-generating enzyme family protein [Candidatus Neomarinimicrobiota bacterium]
VKVGMASIAAQLSAIIISPKEPEQSNYIVSGNKKQDKKIPNNLGKVDITLTDGPIGLDSIEIEIVKSLLGTNMVKVKGGTFIMGDNMNLGDSDEQPNHKVTISDFLISKYEVTQRLYEQVMGANPSRFKGESNPVEKVSWYDAIQFCNFLSQIEGLISCYSIIDGAVTCDWSANGYRLPTESEWEFSARSGGHNDLTFSGAAFESDLEDYSWFRLNSGSKTHEVGTKSPNRFGLHDMSGNVREWCWDRYGSYNSETQKNPTGTEYGLYNIVRGGSYSGAAFRLRTSARGHIPPKNNWYDIGFRVLRNDLNKQL